MRRFSFEEGVRVIVDGDTRRLLALTPTGDWQLVDETTRSLVVCSVTELHALYAAEALEFVDERPPESAVRPRLIADAAPADQARVALRSKVLKEVKQRTSSIKLTTKICVNGRDTTVLAWVLRELSIEMGLKRPIAVATYYRWRAALEARGDPADLAGRFSSRGRHGLDPSVRRIILKVFADALELAKERQKPGQAPFATMRAMTTTIREAIENENAWHGILGSGTSSL